MAHHSRRWSRSRSAVVGVDVGSPVEVGVDVEFRLGVAVDVDVDTGVRIDSDVHAGVLLDVLPIYLNFISRNSTAPPKIIG